MTHFRWFSVFVFILSIILLIVSISNIIYFNRIRRGSCNAISRNQADTGFWLNIIISILIFITLLWSLSAIFMSHDVSNKVVITKTKTSLITPVPSNILEISNENGSSVPEFN